ncbi:hypothetical protein [Verrucosispora sp. TAA-831]|uniref:hypothetical protein n=1 Tax=Verrucosispora sp. TAA-831 TaxID=3422227 RepID=UPI003D6FA84A
MTRPGTISGWGGQRLARRLGVLLALLLLLIAAQPAAGTAAGRHRAATLPASVQDGHPAPPAGTTVVQDDDRTCPADPLRPGKQACRAQKLTVAPTTISVLPALPPTRWRPVPPRPDRQVSLPLLDHLRPRLTQLAVFRT